MRLSRNATTTAIEEQLALNSADRFELARSTNVCYRTVNTGCLRPDRNGGCAARPGRKLGAPATPRTSRAGRAVGPSERHSRRSIDCRAGVSSHARITPDLSSMMTAWASSRGISPMSASTPSSSTRSARRSVPSAQMNVTPLAVPPSAACRLLSSECRGCTA